MQILEVAIPCPLRRSFDYLPPADGAAVHWRPGMRLLVPFGNRRVVGVLLATKRSSTVEGKQLKAALRALDEEPTLDTTLLELGRWAANYYHHPIGDCLQQMLPVRLRQEKPPRDESPRHWRATEAGRAIDLATLKRAPQQLQLLTLLRDQGSLSRDDLREAGFKLNVLHTLQQKGLAEECADSAGSPAHVAPADAPRLNAEQRAAVDGVSEALGRYQGFLLEGVTGSGKTEVYLQLIERCIGRGQQALVLIPEIGLTPQTLSRFEHRFGGEAIAVLHSGLGEVERLRGWQRARTGSSRIVVGTRSAIFTPFADLGLIVVDEEHDPSYKQQDGFRYSARDLAVKRAADARCPVLLGSATPALETLFNASRGRYRHLQLRERATGASTPRLQLLDIRDQSLQDGLGEYALGAIDDTLRAGNQALVFLNRRGFSPILQCHSCGWIAGCSHCDARMTVHARRHQLRCHHCDFSQPLPTQCPQCHNRQLMYRGPGTERLEISLQQRFPQYRLIRIDRDTTATRHAMHNMVNTVKQGEPCILVGTQMLAKGHHFPDVTTVAIVDLDNGLFSADFRAAERTGQLLVQVAGRAGRADKPGRVLIQTHCPDHPLLQLLIEQGYPAFARELLKERKLLQLPPYGFTAILRADATRLDSADGFLRRLRESLPPSGPQWQVIGPLPAPMTRKAGRYRALLLVQAEQRKRLHELLRLLCAAGERQRGQHGLRWSVDVDPVDMG